MKLLIVDGNSILNRAFFAVKGLTNSSGFPTNAIFGFYNTLDKILKEDEFTHVVVAFDLKFKTFRHDLYDKYKANRTKMPNELFLQLEKTKDMLQFLGINICTKKGFEADDIIGSLSRIFSSKNVKVVIATGDRDCFQLINENVVVRLSSTKDSKYYDEDEILKKYGVLPKSLIEVKALMGDVSDNIPGIKGIGEKTALKLIKDHKTVEEIFKDVSKVKASKRIKDLLLKEESKDLCFLSKKLGTICSNIGLEEDLEQYRRKEINVKKLIEFFKELELKKILKNFLETNEEISKEKPVESYNVLTNENIEYVLKLLENLKFLDFYLDECLYVFVEDKIFKFSYNFKREAFLKIVSNSQKPKRTTNLKYVYEYCYVENLNLNNVVFSCDLAAYLLDVLDEDFSLKNIALKYCEYVKSPEGFVKIVETLKEKIHEKNLSYVLEKIELPLVKVLFDMEKAGIKINKKEMEKFGETLKKDISVLKEEIFSFCNKRFNLNSPKELAVVLFDELGLKKGKKTKTGYSTDVEVLKKLVKYSPVVEKIIDYRVKSKLNSTYVEGLESLIKKDGRIHSHFNQTKTKTGRISSYNPNIQNIPVRTELGSKMRKFFTAGEGKVLIDADYSQIELRILAELSQDEKMIENFKKGGDIHNLTAEEIFGFVSKETRDRAKTINFSVIYGVGAFSLAKDIGVGVVSAKKYIDSFFDGYLGVKKYFENIVKGAEKTGVVKTFFGRIRKVPEIFSKNKNILELGKRIVKNTAIQGTAADVIKIAMVKLNSEIEKNGFNAKIILQVHDEILLEVLKEEAEEVLELVKKTMQNAVNFKVLLVCKAKIAKTWYDAKD